MQNEENNRSGLGLLRYIWIEWFSTFVILLLLLLTLIIGTGEMIHGQLLRGGERLYGNEAVGMQYSFLRAEPTQPSCDRHPNIDAQVQQQMKTNANDEFADIFGTTSEADVRASVLAGQQQCEEKYQFYDKAIKYIDDHPSLRTYRTIETSFFGVFKFGTENRVIILLLMVVVAAITASVKFHHIGLRAPTTKLDYRVYAFFMLLANGLLTGSVLSQYHSIINSGVTSTYETLVVYWLWIFLFVTLTLISLVQLFKPPVVQQEGKGNIGLALLSVPLYAYMALVTGLVFTFVMDYPMGQGIYLGILVEFSGIFLNLALFIWAGMLLTQTRVMDLFLGILRPWNLAPETLTWLILIAAAIPTAYTGASGIFVVAAGAIIYREVWNSGSRRQYALAVSAMSGSLGVVIRPCLLVILISMLDSRHVTSDELFDHGIYVFWLTAFIFLGISLYLAETRFRVNSPKVAVPAMLKAVVPVIPYIVITIIVIGLYKYGLDTKMDEFTAPVILPIILIAYIMFDKWWGDRFVTPPDAHAALALEHEKQSTFMREHTPHVGEKTRGFRHALWFASAETVGHIGALIILMALSASVGGLIERSEVVELLPTHLSNIYISLAFIALLLAIIGMTTDPFGAVILVAATIAPVAYENGIHPIHFWMIVLVAFELGYVTPPVALNHLLTRMSVGDAEVRAADAEAKAKYNKFYYRYERWLLPIMVLFPSLLIVTYAPYLFKMFGWYQ